MKNDPTFNPALVGIYRTAVAVSALIISLSSSVVYAANPPVVPTNPLSYTTITTPYNSTTSPPQISHIPPRGVPNVGGGSSYPVRPTRPITPIVSNGGFNAPVGGGVTIEGVKSPPIPTSGTANYPKPTVNNAAKSLLRNNLGGIVLGAGLQALLDGIGGLIDEGGQLQMIPPEVQEGVPEGFQAQSGPFNRKRDPACMSEPNATCIGSIPGINQFDPANSYYCLNTFNGHPLTGYSGTFRCYYGGERVTPPPVPMPPDVLDDAVDSSYNPQPSDFDNLSPYMFPQSFTQNPIPTVYLPTVTTTQSNASGDTTTTNTTTKIDFTVDNTKPNPDVETTVTEDKESFTNGEPSGSSSTSTTNRPNENPKAPPESGTGGSSSVEPPEMPTDCDLFPTACAWFDWTQEEPIEPDTDLSGLLQEVPIVSETFTITGGVATCPAPLVLDLSVFGSREVSYQPLCDLASTMKYLYLALMSFAAAVLLNRSINRV